MSDSTDPYGPSIGFKTVSQAAASIYGLTVEDVERGLANGSLASSVIDGEIKIHCRDLGTWARDPANSPW